MAPRREVFHGFFRFSHSAIHHPGCAILLVAVLASGCGQASPQGLDELGAKPGTRVLTIYPQNAQVEVRESVQFELRDGSNRPADGPVSWSATGGTITRSGLYTAGQTAGTYSVTAKSQGNVVTQKVKIVSSSTSDPGDDTTAPDSGDGGTDDPTWNILFADDFERGDFKVWSGAAKDGDPYWNGSGDGGAHLGDGFITSEMTHSGKLAWKALVDPAQTSAGKANKSGLTRWKGMGAQEFQISAWYFIPSDYPAVGAQLMQIKSGGSGSSNQPVGIRIKKDKELLIRNAILGSTIYRTGVKAPLGRWFNLTGRFVIADSGLVELWLDGKKIASVRTDTKDNDFAYPGVGNYINDSDLVKCHMYIDDVKVTY